MINSFWALGAGADATVEGDHIRFHLNLSRELSGKKMLSNCEVSPGIHCPVPNCQDKQNCVVEIIFKRLMVLLKAVFVQTSQNIQPATPASCSSAVVGPFPTHQPFCQLKVSGHVLGLPHINYGFNIHAS